MSEKNVFDMERATELEHVEKTVTKPIKPEWKKERKAGNTTLTYIGGHVVVRLLNRAFGYTWSFEIIREEIVESLPKVKKGYNGGKDTVIPQPPVVKVLGRLTVPGYGVKEQYGSKILIGGATEQESAFKAAATDAMKKCASLFEIGLELYGEEGMEDIEEEQHQRAVEEERKQALVSENAKPASSQLNKPQETVQTSEPEPQPRPQPQTQPAPQTQSAPSEDNVDTKWDKEEIKKLKYHMQLLGATEKPMLDPFLKEMYNDDSVTYKVINPDNIEAINEFLKTKAEEI